MRYIGLLSLVFLTGCLPNWLGTRTSMARIRFLDGPLIVKPTDKPVIPPAVAVVEPKPPIQPKNILALSGGGSFGAYSAGVINGWTRTNERPTFDVVTGISTGALIAPAAFLGPKYDELLRKFYTEVERKDVLRFRNLATIPFRDAAASSAPLRKILETHITSEMLDEIAIEHRKGRRLYVATMNLDDRRSVVWDLGEMACRKEENRASMVRDVILASCSIPGVFPPVPLDVVIDGKKKTEMHVDGGVVAPVFVPPDIIEAAGKDANLYVLIAGKFYSDATAVRPKVLKVLSASGGALMHSQTRKDVANLYHMAELHGLKFHVTALRQEFLTTDNGIEFHPNEMSRLFVEGVRVGIEKDWQTTPPERSTGEANQIRTGPQLRTTPKP
ncbi:MAG: patatin-like phospholipase family protein [Fimbriiglobus sp.]